MVQGLRVSLVRGFEKLQRYSVATLRWSGLYRLVRAIYKKAAVTSKQSATKPSHGFIPTDIAQLTPRCRHIYVELKASIEKRRKGQC